MQGIHSALYGNVLFLMDAHKIKWIQFITWLF